MALRTIRTGTIRNDYTILRAFNDAEKIIWVIAAKLCTVFCVSVNICIINIYIDCVPKIPCMCRMFERIL